MARDVAGHELAERIEDREREVLLVGVEVFPVHDCAQTQQILRPDLEPVLHRLPPCGLVSWATAAARPPTPSRSKMIFMRVRTVPSHRLSRKAIRRLARPE